ncbi:hypothetical protein [Aeromonas phage AerS_266]|nr:hypothetical protein [Aeromonas phage AerS_266]
MTVKKKSAASFESIEAQMEPFAEKTNLSEIQNQSVPSSRLEPEDTPTIFINDKQIELIEVKQSDVPNRRNRFSRDRGEVSNKGYFGAYNQDDFETTRKNNKWFYALVNHVKIYISLGSKIKLKDIETSYGNAELELVENCNVLILNGGSIEGKNLYINNLVNLYNVSCKIENSLDLSKVSIRSSTLEMSSGAIKSSSISNSSIRGDYVWIDEHECKETSINVTNRVSITKCDFNKFTFGNWSKGGTSLVVDDVNIWDFSIHARASGVYTVRHRSHYGIIQGIDSNEFMLISEDDYRSKNIGMYIKDRIVTMADLKNDDRFKTPFQPFQPIEPAFTYQPNVPTIIPENDIQKFIFSLFNQAYAPKNFPSFNNQSIWSQYDHIKSQIESRLNLWELIASVTKG